ncbi:MAG: hypothetical protein O3C27_09080 [Actinomycetota bacterium]|nr:hypothetical protein [Actinomycetota bacterium]
MALQLTIDGPTLRLQMTKLDQIWTLRRHLEIPLEAVISASVQAKEPLADRLAFRIRGSSIPGMLLAGSFTVWKEGREHAKERQFWLTFRGAEVLVIDTNLRSPSRIVLEVPDRRRLAAMVNEARVRNA